MLLPVLSALALLQGGVGDPPRAVYNGRERQLEVRIPRIAANVTLDGALDDAVWASAALLTGFSLYSPVDQRPAPDSSEVLVWYSETAIHFGIRAFEPHGGKSGVLATLADRDRVSGDDNIEIQLDPFHDRRRAFVFIVNPLGVQGDGTKSEGGGFVPGSNIGPGQNDLSADFQWRSRGRVTDWGYEVEVAIPFRSLRYPTSATQNWGIQIVRKVQHSGYEQTWTPAKKASASFIAQEGTLVGMSGMRHGQVVELNPELVSTLSGTPQIAGIDEQRSWRYQSNNALGGNIRWWMGSNYVLNGTIKPDFSQVEADALQIGTDLRFQLFYPERRPFFVEGSEQFNVPNTLIYTRQIRHPNAAAKLTGKLGATDIALLSAIDDPQVSRTPGEKPIANILRVRRDFSGQSTVGFLLSDREEWPRFNRVIGGDLRLVFGGMYFAQFQAVKSLTNTGLGTHGAPMWEAVLDRTGRTFGFHYNIIGVHPEFAAWNGFVQRTDFVQPAVSNRFTVFGRQGGLFERYNVFSTLAGVWRYDDFFAAKSLLESKFSASNELTFRGGWSVTVNPTLASYAFDPARYRGYYVVRGGTTPDTVTFQPSDRTTTFTVGGRISTPQFQRFNASVGTTIGRDVDFFETSRVHRRDFNASVDWRPTEKIRVNGSYLSTSLARVSDDGLTTRIRIPRAKVEYQLSRSMFVRFVGQYNATTADSLLRDPRTGGPLLLSPVDGSFAPATRPRFNDFRVDWLFSYRPTPGTVFFAGYGSSLREADPLAFTRLQRENDAFFVKASYLLRL